MAENSPRVTARPSPSRADPTGVGKSMHRCRAWIPLILLTSLLSLSVRAAEEEPWENLFDCKDFKGWKDPIKAQVVEGEAVIDVPAGAGYLDCELVYERTLLNYELEYEFNVGELVEPSLWITLGNGELRVLVLFEDDRRIAPGKWHKLRVEKRATTAKVLLDGVEVTSGRGSSLFALHVVFSSESATRASQARVRNVRLLDLTTSIAPGAKARDGMFKISRACRISTKSTFRIRQLPTRPWSTYRGS